MLGSLSATSRVIAAAYRSVSSASLALGIVDPFRGIGALYGTRCLFARLATIPNAT